MRIKHTAIHQLFQSAVDNWPEDEATTIAEFLLGSLEDGYTADEVEQLKAKDAEELIQRFHAKLGALMAPKLY